MQLHKKAQMLGRLTLPELYELKALVEAEIERREEEARTREILVLPEDYVEKREIGKRCYLLQYVNCGKCKVCSHGGRPHGPYWYAYWSAGGRTRSRYVGKEFKEV